MWRRTGRATWILVAVALAVTPIWAHQSQHLVFKKVDLYKYVGEEERKIDAQLVLDSETRMAIVADEKGGPEKRTFYGVPYDNIERITYEKSAHTRWASGLIVSPFLFFSMELHRFRGHIG